jgi:hypothetical protein
MIVESDRILDLSALKHSRPFVESKKRPQKYWRMVDEHTIDSSDGCVHFNTIVELLRSFVGENSIISDPKGIMFELMLSVVVADVSSRSVKIGDMTVQLSSKDRTYYSLRIGNNWGSVWIWDDDYSSIDLEKHCVEMILAFKGFGWNIDRILPPTKMFERLLLEKTNYGDLPDIKAVSDSSYPFSTGDISPTVITRAWNCFRGGRMESATLGSCTRVFDYDFNSAYFSVLRKLPSLRYIRWVDSKEYVKEAMFGFCRCEVDINDDSPVGLCAVRVSTGSRPIRQYYPNGENGSWRLKSEIDLCKKSGEASVDITEGSWGILKDNAYMVFDRASRILEKALKNPVTRNMAHAMASISWGKMASVTSPFFNPIYASYITGEIRVRTTELALMLERDLIAMSVDGVSVCKRLPENLVSNEIGALKVREIDNMLSVSDYYRYDKKNPPKHWVLGDNGILIKDLNVNVPFGSSKRKSPKGLSLSVLEKNQFKLSPPSSEDVMELYFTTNDIVPWDVW